LATLQEDKSALQKRVDDLEKNSAKEKQALLKEVAAIVASKPGGSTGSSSTSAPVKAEKTANTGKQEGFEYEVKAGDSLWAIAKAYQDAGVKVSVEDIRKSNSMEKSQDLRTGQKLFIPKN
jgi:LysM repeat protein